MKKLVCVLVLSAAMTAASFTPVLAEEESGDVPAEQEEYIQAEVDSQTFDACYTLALNAINAEDYEAAKDYLSVCFGYCDPQTAPDIYADLLLKQACINSIEGKNDLALRNLDAALRIKPDLADAYLVRTDVQVSQGNIDKAIEDLETYIELTEDTSLYATVAQLQEAKGDIEAAQSAYDKYVEGSEEELEEADFQAGLYKMQNGNYEEAIAAFETYRDNETYGAGAMYNIGVCRMNMEDYAGAIEAFNECEEKEGDFEGLYYNRGVCHLLNAEWAEGAADFTTSVEKEPYAEDATYNLGICQMQQEEYETAIDTFTAYIEDGQIQTGGEEEASAEESAEDPADGSTEAPAEENAEAAEEESSEEAPEEEAGAETEDERIINYGAYYYRAICQEVVGDLDAALADYTVCIDNGYELTQSYYQRAQVYAALGDVENQNLDLAESLKYAE